MFAKNKDGTDRIITVTTKAAADTPKNPYVGDYGNKVPAPKLAQIGGKWQRVYVQFLPTGSKPWVQIKGEKVRIQEAN